MTGSFTVKTAMAMMRMMMMVMMMMTMMTIRMTIIVIIHKGNSNADDTREALLQYVQ